MSNLKPAKDLVCPLTARPCGELHHCAWWDKGKNGEKGQCVIQTIAECFKEKKMTEVEFAKIKTIIIQGIVKIKRHGLSYKLQPGDRVVFVDGLKKQLEQVLK